MEDFRETIHDYFNPDRRNVVRKLDTMTGLTSGEYFKVYKRLRPYCNALDVNPKFERKYHLYMLYGFNGKPKWYYT